MTTKTKTKTKTKKTTALATLTAPAFHKPIKVYTPPPPKVFIGGPVSSADLDGSVLMEVAYRACTTRRAHGSETEAQFCAWLATTFGATMVDGGGNLHFDRRLRSDGTMSRTLFTSHADTVDNQGGTQHIYTDEQGRWGVDSSSKCLGADDGAGVAMMMEMIAAGAHGYWIVTRDEEAGGTGAKWLADNMAPLLKQFDRAIAFDRAGHHDVITHQAGGRCCSDEFADALSTMLSSVNPEFMFLASDGGVYTDTAEFTSIIPCCTNLSIFYGQQHGNNEWLDIKTLRKFADVVCTIDWDALPTKRDPKEYDDLYGGMGSWRPQRYGTHTKATHSTYADLAWDDLTHAVEDAYKYHPALLIEWVSKHAAAHYDDPVKLSAANITLTLNRKADALIASDVLGWMEAECDWPSITPAEFAADVLEYVIN